MYVLKRKSDNQFARATGLDGSFGWTYSLEFATEFTLDEALMALGARAHRYPKYLGDGARIYEVSPPPPPPPPVLRTISLMLLDNMGREA